MRRLALLLFPLALAAVSIPQSYRARIHAVEAPYDYFPANDPPGLAFKTWRQEQPGPGFCSKLVYIDYDRPDQSSGHPVLEWSTARGCYHERVACSSQGYPGYDAGIGSDQTAIINGRRAYYKWGNIASSAWACIPIHTRHGDDMVVVGVWEEHVFSADQAMRFVANAVPY